MEKLKNFKEFNKLNEEADFTGLILILGFFLVPLIGFLFMILVQNITDNTKIWLSDLKQNRERLRLIRNFIKILNKYKDDEYVLDRIKHIKRNMKFPNYRGDVTITELRDYMLDNVQDGIYSEEYEIIKTAFRDFGF